MSKARKLKRIFDKMKSNRTNEDTTWQEVARWVRPDKYNIFNRQQNVQTKGEERHQRVYDQTAEHSNELLASALQSLLTPSTQHFFEYTTGNPLTNKIPRVRKYLQDVEAVVHEILNNSNFHSETHSNYLDIPSFGTTVLWMEEDDETNVRFRAEPIFTHYIDEDENKVIKRVGFIKKMKVVNAFRKYGMEAFGDQAKKLGKDLDKEIEILCILMDRKDVEQYALDSEGNRYTSYHIYLDKDIVLAEYGYSEFPVAVPRWYKTSGEIYGRSPAMKALPETRYLNQLKRVTIRAAQKATDPPLAIQDDGVLGRVNLRPGGLTSVRQSGRDNNPIQPIMSGSRPDIGQEAINAARQEIRQAFYVDQLQMPLQDRMTTVEVNVRDEDRIRLLAPLIGRLNVEWLAVIVARVTAIAERNGLLPGDVPPELEGVAPKVFFKSQIARAQRMMESQNLTQWIMGVGELAQLWPEAAMVPDIDKYVRKQADLQGVDLDVVKSEQEVQALQQQQLEQMQQQQQAEQGVQESEAVKNVAQAAQAVGG